VNLKLNYTFQEVDGQLNALVKIQTEIHISALSFGDDYKRVYALLFFMTFPTKLISEMGR
jgi:hypothetical protein